MAMQVKQFSLKGVKVLGLETLLQVILISDWLRYLILASDWLTDLILTPDWLLQAALDHFLVLEVGVVEQKFVSHGHSRDWLLHSFKMTR